MLRLLRSIRWAGQGLRYCLKGEKNFQVHCGLALVTVFAGFVFGLSTFEWMIIIICIAAVLAFEMINTAIEHLCNIAHPSIHPSVKIIKDVSAGAVLLTAVMSVLCGAIIFIPKIIAIA